MNVQVKPTKTIPLEHYNTPGFVIVGLSAVSVYIMYRVSRMIKAQVVTAKPLQTEVALHEA